MPETEGTEQGQPTRPLPMPQTLPGAVPPAAPASAALLAGASVSPVCSAPLNGQAKTSRVPLMAAYAQITTAAIALVGVVGLFRQFQSYNEANEREDRRRSDDAVSRLYATEIDVRKFLSTYPEIREYLVDDPDGKKFEKLRNSKSSDATATVNRVRLACGIYGNFFEYYLLIESSINHQDKESIRTAFHNYIASICERSAALRMHLNEYRETWTSRLIAISDAAERKVGGNSK
jgi:hypothetical protein